MRSDKREEKLDILATSAASYFDVSIVELKGKSREALYTKPRHICHWVAVDAGYPLPVLAKYWDVDRTSIYYGHRVVNKRIDDSAHEMREVKAFMRFVQERMTKRGKRENV